MAYSDRQVHCLNAMGLVAWVQRSSESARCADTAYSEKVVGVDTNAAITPDNSTNNASLHDGSLPVHSSIDNTLAQDTIATTPEPEASSADNSHTNPSLLNLPLSTFSYRSQQTTSIGVESASVLVVALTGEAGVEPLDNQASQLFDLMIRAIKLPKNAVRICAVSSHTVADLQQSSDPTSSAATSNVHQETHQTPPQQPVLSSLCADQIQAVLLLDPLAAQAAVTTSVSADVSESVSLSNRSLPVWRIVHPQVLLQAPEHKRQAWEVLKQLQRQLSR